jgi:hypothetical protein
MIALTLRSSVDKPLISVIKLNQVAATAFSIAVITQSISHLDVAPF